MSDRLTQNTDSYQEALIQSLKERNEAAAYLQVALDEYQADGDAKSLLVAFRNVAEAYGGVGQLAKKTNLNRQSLYRTLSSEGNPKLQTLGLILKGLGFHLVIEPDKSH